MFSIIQFTDLSWRDPSVQFINELSEKALVTMNSRSFQNKNMKGIHTKLNTPNLCHSYTIYGDLSSCLRFDIQQRKAWIRVGPPSRFESQHLIKILRKLTQVILQALWKEYSIYLIPHYRSEHIQHNHIILQILLPMSFISSSQLEVSTLAAE